MADKRVHPVINLDDPSLSEEQQSFLKFMVEERAELELMVTLTLGSRKLNSMDGQITAIDRCIGYYWNIIRGFHSTRPSQFAQLN